MMYLPNRNLELFGEPPSLDEPSDNDLNVLDKLEKFAQIEIPSYRYVHCTGMFNVNVQPTTDKFEPEDVYNVVVQRNLLSYSIRSSRSLFIQLSQ